MYIFSGISSPVGYSVDILRSTWEDHILPGHKIMNGRENQVVNTIQQPDIIAKYKEDSSRHMYYKLGGIDRLPQHYLTVVVQTKDTNQENAEVVTAFPSSNLHGAETGGFIYVKR